MLSIDEGIKWASYLQKNLSEIDENNIDYTLCMLAKNQEDLEQIKNLENLKQLKKNIVDE